MTQVVLLTQVERVRLDAARLEDLYASLGVTGAEDAICRGLEQLARYLTEIAAQYDQCLYTQARHTVIQLETLADEVGMSPLARIARDVGRCLDGGDPVALAATLSRLMRAGDRLLSEAWELQDYSV